MALTSRPWALHQLAMQQPAGPWLQPTGPQLPAVALRWAAGLVAAAARADLAGGGIVAVRTGGAFQEASPKAFQEAFQEALVALAMAHLCSQGNHAFMLDIIVQVICKVWFGCLDVSSIRLTHGALGSADFCVLNNTWLLLEGGLRCRLGKELHMATNRTLQTTLCGNTEIGNEVHLEVLEGAPVSIAVAASCQAVARWDSSSAVASVEAALAFEVPSAVQSPILCSDTVSLTQEHRQDDCQPLRHALPTTDSLHAGAANVSRWHYHLSSRMLYSKHPIPYNHNSSSFYLAKQYLCILLSSSLYLAKQ